MGEVIMPKMGDAMTEGKILRWMKRPGETVPGKSKSRRREPIGGSPDELRRLILQLEEEMHQAAEDLRFEYAARIRDEIADLRRELREVG